MRLEKAIFNVLKFCDFFGISFNFLINKQKSYTTTLGGVFSISMIIIIVACFGYYLNELTKYTKFTFYTQDLQVDHPPSIFVNYQNFSLSIEVKNFKGENMLDDRLFTMSLYQVKSYINEDQLTGFTETKYLNEIIPLSRCNKKNNSYCIDDKYNSTIVLDGTSKDSQMSYLEFQINICIGYTPRGELCYNSTQIKSLLQDSQVKFYYTAYYMQLNETIFPKKSFTAMDSFFLDYGYTRYISYYLKNLLFYSDNDWFFKNFKLTTAYQLDSLRESVKFQDRSSTIFKIQILASNSVINYYRQYTKILQVFVNMGGLINTLFVIGTFVVSYIGDIKMKVFIMNRLFDFVEDEEELSSYKRRSNAKIEELRLFLHTVGKINLDKRNSEKSKRSEPRNSNQIKQENNYSNKLLKNNLNLDYIKNKNYPEQEEELNRTKKMSNFNNFNYLSLMNFKKKNFNLGDGKIIEIHPEDGVSVNFMKNRKESLTEEKQNQNHLDINVRSPERNQIDINYNTDKSDTPSSTRALQALKHTNQENYDRKKLSLEGIDISLNRDSVLLRRNTDNNPYSNLPLSTSIIRKSQDLSIQDKSKVEDINNLKLEQEQDMNLYVEKNNNEQIEEHELEDNRGEISQFHLPDLADDSQVKEQNLCDDSKVNLEEIEKLISAEEKRNKKFTLNYSDLFCVAFCCCIAKRSQHKKKYNRVRMYEKAEMEMAKTFDVVEMFKELHKMSGFISFFFNKKQLYLLNHLDRPKIIFKNLQPDNHKKKVENLIKSFNSYIDLKNNLDNLINMKLLEKIDLNTKEVFNKMMESG